MSRLRRLLPYAALLAFSLYAAAPLLRAQMMCTDDGFYHINKAIVLEQVIRAGHFFGRWMPQMAHGYGFPHFNYYAPLASYVLIGLHNLGLIYPAAFHLFLVLCVWLAGVGAFLLAREWWGEAAGLAAGVVYMTAPYLGFDVVIRGVLAETFALTWPPFILYFLHRALFQPPAIPTPGPASSPAVARSGGPWSVVRRPLSRLTPWDILAALAFAAILYSHNTTALAAAPLVGGYVLLLALLRRRWQVLARGAFLMAMGLALSARFWIPALGERGLVQSDRLLVPPIFTYYTNFLTPGELLAPPAVVDPLLVNASPAKGLGLAAGLLALAGLAAVVYRSRPRKGQPAGPGLGFALYIGLALLAYALLTLPFSRPVWDVVPLLLFVQFPWRLLGPAALCAGLLAGAAVLWVPRRAGWIALLVALAAALAHLSWWYPRYCEPFAEITLARTVQYEYDTFTLGTTAKGEFLPVTVHLMPEDDSIAEALMRGEPPVYLTGLPDGASLSVLDEDTLDYRAQVSSPQAFRIIFNQFYFPGWRAEIDGALAPIQLTPDTGLMTVQVPAGAHSLHFTFGPTPLRAASEAISLFAGLALLAAGLWLIARRGQPIPAGETSPLHLPQATHQETSQPPRQDDGGNIHPPPTSDLLPLASILLPLTLLTLRLLLVDRTTNPLRHSAFDGARVSTAQVASLADFAGGVRLFGYDLSAARLPADGFVDVSLYASVREPVQARYWPAFHILDAQGRDWIDPDYLPPRWHKEPTHTPYWSPGQYAQWARHLQLLPGAPPGEYQLLGEVFSLDSLQIASQLDEQGNAVAPRFVLGTLTVTRPEQPFDLQPENAVRHDFGPVTLLGYDLRPASADAGEAVRLDLYWRSAQAPGADLAARLELLSADGQPRLSLDLPPVPGYPASLWQAGDEWRGQHWLRLPASLPGGEYTLRLSIVGMEGGQLLGQLSVAAPERVFTRPEVRFESGAAFEGAGVLEGYDLQAAEGRLGVKLIWRATASPETSYHVFVHLSGAEGRVWAQSDGVPADWSRPTTGWLSGEYIVDERWLDLPADLPPGEYSLYVGLYDPASNLRLPALGPGAGPDNRVQITSLQLP